jgi:CHAT domain-containing protein
MVTSSSRIDFLIDEVSIAFAPSATVWAHLQDRAETRTGPTGVLALAPLPAELPGSAFEIQTLQGLLGDRARALTGSEATEGALRTAAPSFGALHLATSGRLNRANPLFSWLDFTPDGSDDGRLEVHEIYGFDLSARLVVLSACETALGAGTVTNAPAGDDWVGLTRAFLTAGADNVVASLWRVEDLATARLMERFYQGLVTGRPLPEALAEAQRALIADPATAHPFYWAGFSLVGESRGSL